MVETFNITRVRRYDRILDFDIENRPLNYWYEDRTAAEITAIAWSWYGEEEVHTRFLAPPPDHETSAWAMLMEFVNAYNDADMVTGHYIRRHDLPTINAMLLELGEPGLSSKMVSDTQTDLVKHANLSMSQKSLSEMLEVPRPKIEMPQAKWRDANRLTPQGILAARARVVGDVMQHKLMRQALIREGWLGVPRLWTP